MVQSKNCRKLFVLTHEKYRDAASFPADIRKAALQEFYSADEYESCDLVRRAIGRAAYLGLAQLIYER